MGNIKLIIYHNKQGFDVSELVSAIEWGGRKGAAARSLNVTLLDDSSIKNRIVIVPEKGFTCVFKWKGKEKFRGIIMRVGMGAKKRLTFTAYDECIYLANSADSFSYKNKTASAIFKDCIKRAGLSIGEVIETGHKIPSLQKPRTSYYDCLLEALSITYKKTGQRYYIRADKGKVSLLKRKEQKTQLVLEIGQNITDYTFHQSIEKIKTRVRIYSDKGKVLYENKNAKLEKQIGRFVMVDTAKEKHNNAQIRKLANTLMKEQGHPEKSLNISSLGEISAISGNCLYVKIPHLKINRTFYIDEDRHMFKGNGHTMSLLLNFSKAEG